MSAGESNDTARAVRLPVPTPPAPRSRRSRASACPCCGHQTLRPTRQPGRACRYRNLCLTLPGDLPVPTCSRCQHSVLTYQAVPQLKATLEQLYRAELTHRAAVEISLLSRLYSQRKLEVAMNLSQGYLCRLRSGDGIPSFALVCLLALLRAEPTRVQELQRYWALPLEPLRPAVPGTCDP